jgi:hypothetical protein
MAVADPDNRLQHHFTIHQGRDQIAFPQILDRGFARFSGDQGAAEEANIRGIGVEIPAACGGGDAARAAADSGG